VIDESAKARASPWNPSKMTAPSAKPRRNPDYCRFWQQVNQKEAAMDIIENSAANAAN